MNLQSRKLLDRSFTAFSGLSIAFMALALVILLGPIIYQGLSAYFFTGTIEHRKVSLTLFERGNKDAIEKESALASQARAPLYAAMSQFKGELKAMMKSDPGRAFALEEDYGHFKTMVHRLLGPAPGERTPAMMRDQYGITRWDQAQLVLHDMTNVTKWDYTGGLGVKVFSPRADLYKGTALEPVFSNYLSSSYAEKMLLPEFTFYYGFLTDTSSDAHFFGGIWPEVLGTIYLTFGAMLLAIPAGILAAVYLVEYAGDTKLISLIRSCISTLAGVPSIVFGLFGLACFISDGDSWFQISRTPSVAAGCATLALLILPTIIRASEEAIRAIPLSYREASMGLGATKWKTISSVILPAALPGILTGIVISMGRAAGETAPIIFTAAVSVGKPLGLDKIFSEPTPALPWNIYNLCTEHAAVDQIRHVQYGMVFTLIAIVLLLNLSAIYLRARIANKLHG